MATQRYTKADFEILGKCPWCGSVSYRKWGNPVGRFRSVKCDGCELIYVQNRLNKKGLEKHYRDYLSGVHQADKKANRQREAMYELEFGLVDPYCRKGRILDVGCSGGYFLDHFKKSGYKCYGVEFGEAAAKEAMKKYPVYFGDFADLKIDIKFDLIVFRGVIEHVADPKTYLKKAIKLLKEGGYIYITSTPNSRSLCCELFKEMWNQHAPEGHLMHFMPRHFDEFFASNKFRKVVEYYFYEETPYADVRNDVLKVADTIKRKRKKLPVDYRSPAFYGNMMSLIYKKCGKTR